MKDCSAVLVDVNTPFEVVKSGDTKAGDKRAQCMLFFCQNREADDASRHWLMFRALNHLNHRNLQDVAHFHKTTE